ncbi:MAG: hydrogenase expression/formation protein HypE [Anaerohalosphaeraceae bacterium]|nr:hydrogenase expression/formation protein HypE [Anaerohalosphaeraceae bacterium]
MSKKIMLAHGGGGRLSAELIDKHIVPRFANPILEAMGDSAKIQIEDKVAFFTTDSYVVKPLFFNGGDIGKLAVYGTVNDLLVAGANPIAISLSLIIEEGLEMDVLDKILDSVAIAAKDAGVKIVCGDTKTVDAGSADEIFINTAGVGEKMAGAELSFDRICPGDKIIVSGSLGDHGMTIMSHREGMKFESDLKSDCASVASVCKAAVETCGADVKFMRDPTRGGAATTLNEISVSASVDIEIEEAVLPIKDSVQAAADMLGFDVLEIANEGKVVIVVSADKAAKCLEACRATQAGAESAIIGTICEKNDEPIVELITRIGGRRVVQMPYGRELPRIC